MFTAILALLSLGQVCDTSCQQGYMPPMYREVIPYNTPSYNTPSYRSVNDIPTYIGRPIYHELKCCEGVRTKTYVMAILSNGTRTQIPIVNGYLPEIRTKELADGSTHRTFIYNRQIPYEGGIPKYIPATGPLADDCEALPVRQPTTAAKKTYPKPMSVPAPAPEESEKVQGSKIDLTEPEEKVVNPSSSPKAPAPAPESVMKRPSEVDGSNTKIGPSYE